MGSASSACFGAAGDGDSLSGSGKRSEGSPNVSLRLSMDDAFAASNSSDKLLDAMCAREREDELDSAGSNRTASSSDTSCFAVLDHHTATREEVIAKRGSLAFGAAQRNPLGSSSFEEDKMPRSTLKLGRRGGRGSFKLSLDDEDAEWDDVNLGESTSSQLKFDRVIPLWKKLKKAKGGSKKKFKSKFSASSCGSADERGDPSARMWEVFFDVLEVPEDNPGRRHACQTFASEAFKKKVDYLFTAIDTSGTGFLEKHEFAFLTDGLRGRMHHFLRNTRQLYFMQEQDELPPTDQEFVLSPDFKSCLLSSIQRSLFTWRMMPQAWAVDRKLFSNLVELLVCSTVHLVMTEAEKFPIAVPVAVELYLLMSRDGSPLSTSMLAQSHLQQSKTSPDPNAAGSDTEASTRSGGHLEDSLFCRTVFDLHLIVPPQTVDFVDETILEDSMEDVEVQRDMSSARRRREAKQKRVGS